MPLTKKQLEFAETINSSGKDLLIIINDILDLSKVQAGEMYVNFEKLYLSELAQYIDKSFSQVVMQKGIEFKIEMQEGLTKSIVSDVQRVQQIINNLLSNAIKFTESGGVTMTFHTVKDEEILRLKGSVDNFIGISIADTGIGIPIDKQSIIFEAFKQSDGTTSRKYGGTGLGLSISRKMAHLLGGRIGLKSNEGHGSTFTLILPITINNQEQLLSNTISKETDSVKNLKGIQVEEDILVNSKTSKIETIDDRKTMDRMEKCLLIIEDDEKFANTLLELARSKGYKCLIAAEGLIGINLAIKYKPDAVLLDIGLPDIIGWKVVEKLKGNKDTENIPIHVISGVDNNSSSEEINSVSQVSLFLHDLDSKIEDNKFKIIKHDHEKEDTLNNKKILVVDDDMRNIFVITSLLEEKGIKVVLGRTGLEAIKSLNENLDVDLILMDIMMPEMDGYKAMCHIRNEEKLKRIPIIAMTAKAMKEDRQKCIDAGADDYITKPLDMDKLISLLRVWLYK